MTTVGDQFPDFTLQDQSGERFSLNDLKGKQFVVFCYPKDSTSG